jgi:hypothetical protein
VGTARRPRVFVLFFDNSMYGLLRWDCLYCYEYDIVAYPSLPTFCLASTKTVPLPG